MLDVLFTTTPYWSGIAQGLDEGGLASPYLDSERNQSGMPELHELLDHYSKIAGWDPRKDNDGKDMEVGKIFHLIRVCLQVILPNNKTDRVSQGATIGHGIKARTYAGQASSEFSHKYFAGIKSGLDLAWTMVEEQRRIASKKDQARL